MPPPGAKGTMKNRPPTMSPPKLARGPPGFARGPPGSRLPPSRGPPGLARGPSGSKLPPSIKHDSKTNDPDDSDYEDDNSSGFSEDRNDNDKKKFDNDSSGSSVPSISSLDRHVQEYKRNREKEKMLDLDLVPGSDQKMTNETMNGLKTLVVQELLGAKLSARQAKHRIQECEEALLRDGLIVGDYGQIRADLNKRRNDARQQIRDEMQEEKEDEVYNQYGTLLNDRVVGVVSSGKRNNVNFRPVSKHRFDRQERRKQRLNRRKVEWVTKCISAMQETGESVDRRKIDLLIKIMKTMD